MRADAQGHDSRAFDVPPGHQPQTPVPVLLVPGGTETGVGSLRGLGELLADQPLIAMDGVGAGPFGDEDAPTLANRSVACLRVVGSHSGVPAVVVGHSLGGVVAVQFAMDHPDAVAGLVLLDPTPFTNLALMKRLRWSAQMLSLAARAPFIGGPLHRALLQPLPAAPNTGSPGVLETKSDPASSLSRTAAAVAGLPEEGQLLTRRLHELEVPVIVVTAGRERTHPMRRSHQEIARVLGGRALCWADAGHDLHVTHTEKVAALVRTLASNGRGWDLG